MNNLLKQYVENRSVTPTARAGSAPSPAGGGRSRPGSALARQPEREPAPKGRAQSVGGQENVTPKANDSAAPSTPALAGVLDLARTDLREASRGAMQRSRGAFLVCALPCLAESPAFA